MNAQVRIGSFMTALCASLALADRVRSQAIWREVPELSERYSHGMVYDPSRQRVVLYGGGLIAALGDTWEWDGRTWHARRPPRTPGVRSGHMMAYDPVRETVLLFGGARAPMVALGDTWEWDGRTWRQLVPKNSPGPRFGAGMATDFRRGRIVLFGGANPSLTVPHLRDTWEWDGTNWIQRTPKTRPPTGGNREMAYNPITRRVMLVGQSATVGPQHAWEWDGTDWIRLAAMPGCREPYGCPITMATDPSGKGVYVLIQGAYNRNGPDTHLRWDGKVWTTLAPRVSPPRRRFPGLVTDQGRRQTLLFGGSNVYNSISHVQDTWAWNGSTWRVAHEWITPRANGYTVAHDAARDEFVVLVQGRSSVITWVFRDGLFIRRKPSKQAPVAGTMLYHAALRKVLLYAGSYWGVWLWDGLTWEGVDKTGPNRYGPLVYDSRRHKVVIYYAPRQDLWEWDTSGWSVQRTSQGPRWSSLGEWYSLGYDPARGRLVAVGGKNTQPPDTWEWDGKLWSLIKPQNRPTPRDSAIIRYVPALGGCVLFGGRTYVAQKQVHAVGTWLWDGKNWTKLQASLPKHFMNRLPRVPWNSAYDRGRQRLVAFYDPHHVRPGSLAWEFFFESLKTSQRYPRPGEPFQMNALLPAQPNRLFVLALSGGMRPGIPLRTVPGVGVELLPLRPDGLFWSSLDAGLLTVLDRTGRGTIRLKVPNDTRLHWTPFHAAGLTLDPLLGIGAITNRVGLEVVR